MVVVATISITLCSGTVPAAEFIGLGLAGVDTNAYGVSGDGKFVVGQGGGDALRWTSTGDVLNLGDLPGNCCSTAYAASLNGSVVVGRSENGNGVNQEAFRWTESGGMLGLGVLPGYTESRAYAASADGSIVIGHNYTGDNVLPSPHEAFLWTEGVGMVGLGTLPGDEFSYAYGVSADGSAVAGSSAHSTPTGFVWEAFRWTEDGGMQGLGTLPGGGSEAFDISADGLTVVGVGLDFEAFRWTAGTGMVGLGHLPGGDFSSTAYGVSADGSVVVGEARTSAGREAFVWDETNGMRRVKDVLTAAGLDMTGWTLSIAWDVSDDGNTIVGRGDNPEQGWLARLDPIPEPCDVNGDGNCDVADVDAMTQNVLAGVNTPADREALIKSPLRGFHTYIGDANLDGEFNTSDLVSVYQAGQYEDDISMNSGWADGDFDGDRDFGTSDLAYAFQDGGYEQGPRVPERSGDFNGDGVLDATDVDLLTEHLVAGRDPSDFDLNNDSIVDREDHRVWVKDLRHTWFGDANLNGEFNSADLVNVFREGEYEDGIAGNSGWAEGDWDGNAEFDTSDLVVAFTDGGYNEGSRTELGSLPVPEPTSLLLMLIAFGGLAVLRRRAPE